MQQQNSGTPIERVVQQMEFLRLFRLLNSILRESVDRHMKELDLTASQLDVLVGITQHPDSPVNQRDIEEELQLSKPTVTGILKRLERKGFITRTVGARDRRYREVRLTEKSVRLAESLYPEGRQMLQQAFRGFTPEEFYTLNRLLRRLLENCTRTENSEAPAQRQKPQAAAACPLGFAQWRPLKAAQNQTGGNSL